MKTPQQWLDEMKARPCVTEADLLTIIKRIQDDARKDAQALPSSMIEAFNSGSSGQPPLAV
jgi:hypothetical protein